VQFATVNGVTIHYQVIGAAGKPLIVFVNSLGTDFRIWRDVVVRLAGDFAVLCYDKRGHGLSGVGPTPYRMADHAADLAALLDLLGQRDAIVCGLSVGGMVAQQLWADRPDLVSGLILCDTAHRIGTEESWNKRIAAVEQGGIEAVADAVMPLWFTPALRASPEGEGYRNMLCRQPRAGYVATCAAIRDADLTDVARRIDVPTLVVVGDQDGSTPPELCAAFARLVPGARYEVVKDAAHIVPVEQPVLLTEIIKAFADLMRQGETEHARQRH
jgi:3-oxoadipate enol-lactonase